MKSLKPLTLNTVGFAGLVSLAALNGCGLQTNPTSNYGSLSHATTPANFEAAKEAAAKIPAIQILSNALVQLEGAQGLNFVEGTSSSYTITPETTLNGVQISLSAKNLPAGATFAPSTDSSQAGSYTLTWNAAPGTLSDQVPFQVINVEIDVNVVSTPDAATAKMMQSVQPLQIQMTLTHTRQQAVIEKIVVSSQEITIGDKDAMTITVRDLDAPAGRVPTLTVTDESGNTATSMLQGASDNVTIDAKPKSLGSGRFQFKAYYDSTGVPFPSKVYSVIAGLAFSAESPSGSMSPPQNVEIKVDQVTTQPTPAPSATPSATPAATPASGHSQQGANS